MPLFESQDRRLKRLFKDSLEALLIHLSKSELDPGLIPLIQKLTLAGSATATAAFNFDPFKSLWPVNQPDKELRIKAMIVTEVFTLAMVSRYLAMLAQRTTPDNQDFKGAQYKLIRLMVQYFADHEPDSLDYFLALNGQFQADVGMPAETERGRRTYNLADVLFLNEAASRLGDDRSRYPNIDELPLYDYTHAQLVDRGVPFFDFVTQVAMSATMNGIAREALAELVPRS